MFKRVALFLATNLAVMVLLGIVLSVLQGVFGVTLGNNGVLLVFATLHLARFIGRMHGKLAKAMLVSSRVY